MPKTHAPYPPEFRQQIVELVRAGRHPKDLAREFEPSAQALWNWVKQADRDAGQRQDGLTTDEREELRRLRREVKQLRIEREVLSKAAAWFARETNSIPLIHHSDHGAQYTSLAFRHRYRQAGIRPSTGSVGDCFDNALCESFFATLECELLDRCRFRNQRDDHSAGDQEP